MVNKIDKEMTYKEMLIQHWEYQKKLILTFGIYSDVSGSIIEHMKIIYTEAIKFYGHDWAKENLKPLENIPSGL